MGAKITERTVPKHKDNLGSNLDEKLKRFISHIIRLAWLDRPEEYGRQRAGRKERREPNRLLYSGRTGLRWESRTGE